MPPLRHPTLIAAVPVALPAGLRAPFGWPLLELAAGRSVALRWPQPPSVPGQGGWLRVTTGIDDRERKRVEVRLAVSGRLLGTLDLRFAHALEPFQLWLDPGAWAEAGREGVTLTLAEPAGRPLWLLGTGLPAEAAALAPHLLPEVPAADRTAAFFERLGSVASVQPFGWMEGCVLDALHDLRATAARDAHLGLFFTRDGRLVYEDPASRPADDHLRCIEETLPFAVLAKTQPSHPLLGLALDYWQGLLQADGSVEDDDRLVSAEGSYTIAYPLAVIAHQRGDQALAARAALQLRLRRERLRLPDGLWLRYWGKDGQRHFRSWARGVAWYLLGLVRSLEHLRGLTGTADLEAEAREAAAWVLGWQRADGLWGCFLDEAATPADTSGSAGIAAALARGAGAGLLTEDAARAARRTWDGLQAHLTTDGLLGGAAQSNRGGEALQRSDYRVLSPMGMGLMGQLAAGLAIFSHP